MRRAAVVCCLIGALAAQPIPMSADTQRASATAPGPLVASRASEIWPAASDSYLAWAENSRRHPKRFRAMVKPAGGEAFRVSKKGRSGFPGGIDGNRLVIEETGRSSNIRLIDLATRERLRLPDQVNTRADEWAPTISGRWLLFGRVEPAPGRPGELWKVMLFDLESGTGRELGASSRRSLQPGQVNGDWALWHSCGEKNCSTFRYRISTSKRERISLAQPTFSGSIAADGTAYFAASTPKCGKEVAFYEYPLDGSAKLLFKLPGGVDVYSSFAYDDGGATKIVFARITCRNLRGDVYVFDTSRAGPPPDVGPDIATGKGTVAYQVDVAHSGQLGDSTLAPPLRKLWTTELGDGISYPLVADGKVFVTLRAGEDYGTAIYALDASTGTIAWFRELAQTYNWSNAAYDDGKVFVVTYDGTMLALDADDGRELWSTQLPDQWSFSSEPTAADGFVYTGGSGNGGTVYAVRQGDGTVAWRTNTISGGDHSSPALAGNDVYVSYSGPQVYAFDRTSGAQRWRFHGCCTGGGGRTPVYHAGYLYVRSDGNHVLDAATGERIGGFDATLAPAFSGTMGFFFNGSKLVAREVPSGSVEWSFQGDGFLSSAPVVANGHVYVGSGLGHVYALERGSGQVAWRGKVGTGIVGPDEHNVSVPVTGLGLGRGILVVPNGRHLTAFVDG
ncbi:MAG TPA: PQQ-binding-like beta-propeller repeat protein [Actinomycetota bacterium]|nr:PQQ-binding-like beta-propeller repeat protein [Actinomycetota bacterium]